MTDPTIKGIGASRTYDGTHLRIAILHARWNSTLISALLAGTLKSLAAAGVQRHNIVIQSVPGSYELPFAAQRMIAAGKVSSSPTPGGGLSAGDLLGGIMSSTTLDSTESTAGGGVISTRPFDALIAIGALIKGSTMHFEYISDAVSHGLMRVQLDTGTPVVFGLLTLLTEEQGRERAGIGGKGGDEGHNHGEDWGSAAVELALKDEGWVGGTFVE